MPEWLVVFFRIINVVEILPHKCQVFCIFYCIIFVFYYFFGVENCLLLTKPALPACVVFFFLLSWDLEGAVFGTQCGEIESGSALVFEKEGRRRVCTPYLDTTSYGNLRFYFTMGMKVQHP